MVFNQNSKETHQVDISSSSRPPAGKLHFSQRLSVFIFQNVSKCLSFRDNLYVHVHLHIRSILFVVYMYCGESLDCLEEDIGRI